MSSSNIKSIFLRNELTKRPTKKDVINMILNNQIKVYHTLQNQIAIKKRLKCFIHGSDRQVQQHPQNRNTTRFLRTSISPRSQKYFNNYEKERFVQNRQLFIQAPFITGIKNVINNKQKRRTNYGANNFSNSNNFTTDVKRKTLKSCCNLRSTKQLQNPQTKMYRTSSQSFFNKSKIRIFSSKKVSTRSSNGILKLVDIKLEKME